MEDTTIFTKYEIKDQIIRLCQKNGWFTCGSNYQYSKMLSAAATTATMEEIATMIWLCSAEVEVADVMEGLTELQNMVREHVAGLRAELKDALDAVNYSQFAQHYYVDVLNEAQMQWQIERGQYYEEIANRLTEEISSLRYRWGV